MGAAPPTPPAAGARCLARAARVQAPGRAPAGPLVATRAAAFHSTASHNGGGSLRAAVWRPSADRRYACSPGSSAVGRAAESRRLSSSLSILLKRYFASGALIKFQRPARPGAARHGGPLRNRSTTSRVGSAGIAPRSVVVSAPTAHANRQIARNRSSSLQNVRSPKAKQPAPENGGGCETQSSRIPHPKHCDGHCQSLLRVTAFSPAGLGSMSPRSDVSGVFR
jgi:hypothetical protein